jgi:hypothetical protein
MRKREEHFPHFKTLDYDTELYASKEQLENKGK